MQNGILVNAKSISTDDVQNLILNILNVLVFAVSQLKNLQTLHR